MSGSFSTVLSRREMFRRKDDASFDPQTNYSHIFFQACLNHSLPAVQEYVARQFINCGKVMGFSGVRLDVLDRRAAVARGPDHGHHVEPRRVVQEAITNVAKHAQARQVSVTLRFDTDAVAVQIHDDGQGFDPSRPIEAGHFGLLGMRERVLSLQGRIDVVSAPGRGTHIDFRVPTQTQASAS